MHLSTLKSGSVKPSGGDMCWCRIVGNVSAIQWRDTRTVACHSNFHNANDSTPVTRLVQQDGVRNREMVHQSAGIHNYNRQMGGVDKSNH